MLIVNAVLLCFWTPATTASPTDEYRLKAALIYKLTKFIEWPVSKDALNNSSFNLCILGKDNFGEALEALESKSAHSKPIKIYRFTQSDSIDRSCQILFIDESKQAFEKAILQSFQGKPVLTLGESSNFAKHGGMIQFSLEGKRIGFKINDHEAKNSNLKIAAPLLQLAIIVKTEGELK